MRVIAKIFGRPLGVLSDEFNERIYFQYFPEYLSNGRNVSPFALSFDGIAQYEKSRIFKGLFGVFADSLPDAWGNILIEQQFRILGRSPDSISPLERLCAVGKKSWGAITYEPEMESLSKESAAFVDLVEQSQLAKDLLQGDTLKGIDDLIESGSPIGGARPKRNIYLDSKQPGKIFTHHENINTRKAWILKLEVKPEKYYGVIEEAYYQLARLSGINTPETCLIKDANGNRHFAIRRFDWSHNDEKRRFHCHTLAGLLTRDFDMGDTDYQDFFSATIKLTEDASQLEEAFRRAVFNIFYSIHDDHVKNHAYTMSESGVWKLSPAYDIMFSRPNPGNMFWRQMSFGGKRRGITMEDIRDMGKRVGLKSRKVESIVEQCLSVSEKWNEITGNLELPEPRKSEVELYWEIP